MTSWGESFGGPPGVPVARHAHGGGPVVRLRHDLTCRGRVLRSGPEQSVVVWDNGNENCVSNTWIVRDEAEDVPQKSRTVTDVVNDAQQTVGKFVQNGAATPAPKVRKEPDALARRVSEYDEAELRAFAAANGCWDDKYLKLPNPGLRRMNVVNRLRAKVKKGHAVVWK